MSNRASDKSFIRTILALLVLGAASVIPYLHTLQAPFVHDDIHAIKNNPALRYHASLKDFFSKPELFSGTKAEMYRPLLQMSYAVNFRLGTSPLGFRLVNLILHMLCGFLVFFLTRMLPRLERMCLPAALLFVLHPVHTETVIYLSCRSTLLASIFILLGLVAFIQALKNGRSRPAVWMLGMASAICLAAGLASKSIAIVTPALALAYMVFFPSERKAPGILIMVILFMLCAAYIILRHSLGLYTLFPPETVRPVLTNLLTQTRVSFFYLRLILWPVHLSLEHHMAEINSVSDPGFVISIIGWLALAGITAWRAKRNPLLIFSISFFIICLAPTSTIIPLKVIASENRLYLASLGLFWPACSLFSGLFEYKRTSRAAGIWILAFLLACFFGITVARGSVWNQSAGLWRDAVSKAFGLARAHVNYGIELKNQDRLQAAFRQYRLAIHFDPWNTWAYTNLGNIYLDQGRYSQAERAYQSAIEAAPGNVNARMNLSHLLLQKGHPEQAAALLEESLTLAPHRADIRHDLGIIYFRYLGRFSRAREELEMSLDLDPGQSDAEMMRRAIDELRMLEGIQEGSGRRGQ
jgi:Tfp pilus assembly protein PilF